MIAYRLPLWPVCAVIAAALMLGGCTKSPPESAAPAFPKQAPAQYRVKFETSKGDFVVRVTKAWSPNGAARFWELVQTGYYDGCRFFRVVPNFVVQFGINGNPDKSAYWRQSRIPDDPVKESNTKGKVTFAAAGPASRTMQAFVNLRDNARLGLDPVIVKAFINLTGIYPVGTVVILDSLELAVVQQASPEPTALSRPIVRLLSDALGNRIVDTSLCDLTRRDEHGQYLRTIIRTEDPERYGITIGDYFV